MMPMALKWQVYHQKKRHYMKAIWKGAIGFGLVNIPVRLFSATQQSNLDLDMVDSRDMGRIHFQRVNEHTGKEVKWENIAKAYKLNDDYIMLEDTDFEQAAPEKSKIIEVNHFVDEEEIDTIYYENSYYIEPEKSGAKAYALLREALTKSGKVGVAQFVMRTASALTVLKPMGDVLVLSKIRFAEEIRSAEEFDLPKKSAVKPAELKMAMSLIDQYSGPFNIEQFKDQYAADLLKVIKAKAKGKKPVAKKMKIVHSKTEDLMAQLKASLKKKVS
jgi:DNA end-binding protein Ku